MPNFVYIYISEREVNIGVVVSEMDEQIFMTNSGVAGQTEELWFSPRHHKNQNQASTYEIYN